MPIELNSEQSLVIPEVVTPAISANVAWIETVIIRAPIEGLTGEAVWSAIIESYPSDGKKVYRRDLNGNDTTIRVESQSLFDDAIKDPTLMGDINDAMKAIIAVSAKIKALRDAERVAQQNNNQVGE